MCAFVIRFRQNHATMVPQRGGTQRSRANLSFSCLPNFSLCFWHFHLCKICPKTYTKSFFSNFYGGRTPNNLVRTQFLTKCVHFAGIVISKRIRKTNRGKIESRIYENTAAAVRRGETIRSAAKIRDRQNDVNTIFNQTRPFIKSRNRL